jgi:Domain of unknown function (DUF4190)
MAIITCPECQREVSDLASVCPKCGYSIAGDVAKTSDLGEDAGMRLLLPVGRSGWAIVAGYLALFSVLCIPAPLALLTGIMAVLDIRKNPKKHGMGRAIFGIVMGGIGTAVILFLLVAFIINPPRR